MSGSRPTASAWRMSSRRRRSRRTSTSPRSTWWRPQAVRREGSPRPYTSLIPRRRRRGSSGRPRARWRRSSHSSAADKSGFMAAYSTKIYGIDANGGAPRAIVDRSGMNTGPRYSPDGRAIAFISTNGRAEIMAPRSLTIAPSSGGPPRVFGLDDAWVNEFVWARDSRSMYLEANDGTFARADHMFEQPIVRVSV